MSPWLWTAILIAPVWIFEGMFRTFLKRFLHSSFLLFSMLEDLVNQPESHIVAFTSVLFLLIRPSYLLLMVHPFFLLPIILLRRLPVSYWLHVGCNVVLILLRNMLYFEVIERCCPIVITYICKSHLVIFSPVLLSVLHYNARHVVRIFFVPQVV